MRRPAATRIRLHALLLWRCLAGAAPTLAAPPETTPPPETLGGIPVVVLSGTHYERGFAHGKALHRRIVDLFDNYIVRRTNPTLFFMMLRKVAPLIRVDRGLEDEARGLVDGALEAGGGRFRSSHAAEDFTWQEILALNTYVDYVGTNCSSISVWGAATRDSELKGDSAIARNLDWSLAPALLRNQVVFVNLPAEKGKVPFLSVGFAGFMGCLSCINAQGLGAFLNLGYSDRAGSYPPSYPFTPASLAFRTAVESRAPGGDLLTNFVTLLTGTKRVGSFIIHAVMPRQGEDDPAVVVELLPDTYQLRRAADDPALNQLVLVATNHNRKTTAPRACGRYQEAVDYTNRLRKVYSLDALWEVRGRIERDDTMQAMLYVPATGEFRLSTLRPRAGKLKIIKKSERQMTPVDKVMLPALLGNPR